MQRFSALKGTLPHIQPNGQFLPVFGQNGQNGENYQKKRLEQVSEKSNERFPRKSVTHERTYARTNTTPKVSNDRWSRDQKVR